VAYGYAVVFGTLYSLLTALASWILFFVVTFRWENQSPAEAGGDDWLAPLAVVWVLSALVVFAGVLTGRILLVAPGFVIGAVAAVPALRYALVDWSDHADGQLIGAAFVIGLCGVLATVLTARVSSART
jgi:hypothetical protein